ncbi:MAG: TadE/TadG family type IV pilus assembly protein [Bacilli bacterium]
MRNKGQALVEFIIILPVLILILMTIVDLGNIIYKKYQLENDVDYISDLYQEKQQEAIDNYTLKNNLIINYEKSFNQLTIHLSKKVTINTPGLNKVLPKPYILKVKRVMYDE